MQNLQVQFNTNIEARNFLTQLRPFEVELLFRESAVLFRQQKVQNKQAKIAKLIRKLNETVLSEQHWAKFFELTEKLEGEKITDTEMLEFEELVREERVLQLKRIKLMGEIAELKGISLNEVAEQLGLKPREYA